MQNVSAVTLLAYEVFMINSVYQSREANYEDGDLKLLVTAFSDAAEAGRWYAILMDLSEPPMRIERDQRAAMRLEDLLPMAQEMLDGYVRCHNKTSQLLEWHTGSVGTDFLKYSDLRRTG